MKVHSMETIGDLLNRDLSRKIEETHSYSCPEIVSLPLERGDRAYLRWLFSNTSGLKSKI